MSAIDELEDMIRQMEAIVPRFVKTNGAIFLKSEDQAEFERIALEAHSISARAVGPHDNFVNRLTSTLNEGVGGFYGGPSYSCVTTSIQIVKGAINDIRRWPPPTPVPALTPPKPPYVDPATLAKLKALPAGQWDVTRLVRLCEELNLAHANGCHMAVAMLVRAIVDHVPPIFAAKNFDGVASNHGGGGASFKRSMQHLNVSLRNIADSALHMHIRRKESVPTETQVDVRRDLDVLLGEVARIYQ